MGKSVFRSFSRTVMLPAIVAALLAGCAAQPTVTRQIPVDSNFTRFTFYWDDTSGTAQPSIRVAKAINVAGRLEVCGAQRLGTGEGFAFESQISSNMEISVNGKVVLKGVGFFAALPRSGAIEGAKANCVDTGLPAPSGPLQIGFTYTGPNRFYSS